MNTDPNWTKHSLGDATSVNLAADGMAVIKQETSGLVESVHLSTRQIDALIALVQAPQRARLTSAIEQVTAGIALQLESDRQRAEAAPAGSTYPASMVNYNEGRLAAYESALNLINLVLGEPLRANVPQEV